MPLSFYSFLSQFLFSFCLYICCCSTLLWPLLFFLPPFDLILPVFLHFILPSFILIFPLFSYFTISLFPFSIFLKKNFCPACLSEDWTKRKKGDQAAIAEDKKKKKKTKKTGVKKGKGKSEEGEVRGDGSSEGEKATKKKKEKKVKKKKKSKAPVEKMDGGMTSDEEVQPQMPLSGQKMEL